MPCLGVVELSQEKGWCIIIQPATQLSPVEGASTVKQSAVSVASTQLERDNKTDAIQTPLQTYTFIRAEISQEQRLRS